MVRQNRWPRRRVWKKSEEVGLCSISVGKMRVNTEHWAKAPPPPRSLTGNLSTGPSPSCPCTLRPAMYTRPEAVTRAECPQPATTCTTSSCSCSCSCSSLLLSLSHRGKDDDDEDEDDSWLLRALTLVVLALVVAAGCVPGAAVLVLMWDANSRSAVSNTGVGMYHAPSSPS